MAFGDITTEDRFGQAPPQQAEGTITIAQPVSVVGPLTNSELRAAPVPVSGNVNVSEPVSVEGPLTDAELRATPVPVSFTEPVSVDDNGGSLTVDGPLTDTELRATPVPVSGTISVTEPVSVDDNGGSLTVDGPLTDTELRATPVPVSISGTGGALTNRSGTITTGGVSQIIAAANSSRKYFILQNVSSKDLWVRFGAAAVIGQPSFQIVPKGGGIIEYEGSFIPTENINVIGATAGQEFSSFES